MTDKPICRGCGLPLRRYPHHAESWAKEQGLAWGGYGDGMFCGLRCARAFAIAMAKIHPKARFKIRARLERAEANRNAVKHDPNAICRNCGAVGHPNCCARCGKRNVLTRNGDTFCGDVCRLDQEADDDASAREESGA